MQVRKYFDDSRDKIPFGYLQLLGRYAFYRRRRRRRRAPVVDGMLEDDYNKIIIKK